MIERPIDLAWDYPNSLITEQAGNSSVRRRDAVMNKPQEPNASKTEIKNLTYEQKINQSKL